jgi:ubiquitin C-terminal hydrolase
VTHKEYFQYKLQGVLVHVGTADSGHYYSFINDREHEGKGWFEFNDQFVHPFDPANIAEECFGGDDPEYETRL